MTSVFKKISIIFMIVSLLVCSFASCGGGINTDEAKAFIGDFFDAVAAEDYEKAETFLHPDYALDVQKLFEKAEGEQSVDFKSGIQIEKYTGFSASYYDSEVDGSRLELTMKASVGEKTLEITVEIVKNDNGYGINNIEIG